MAANGKPKRCISPTLPPLAVENERGIVTLYSLPAMEKRGDLVFSSPIAYMQFSKDGKRLFVFRADQQSYLFNAATAVLAAGK